MSLKQSQFDPKFPDAGGLKVCTIPSLIPRQSGNEIISLNARQQLISFPDSLGMKLAHILKHCV